MEEAWALFCHGTWLATVLLCSHCSLDAPGRADGPGAAHDTTPPELLCTTLR